MIPGNILISPVWSSKDLLHVNGEKHIPTQLRKVFSPLPQYWYWGDISEKQFWVGENTEWGFGWTRLSGKFILYWKPEREAWFYDLPWIFPYVDWVEQILPILPLPILLGREDLKEYFVKKFSHKNTFSAMRKVSEYLWTIHGECKEDLLWFYMNVLASNVAGTYKIRRNLRRMRYDHFQD